MAMTRLFSQLDGPYSALAPPSAESLTKRQKNSGGNMPGAQPYSLPGFLDQFWTDTSSPSTEPNAFGALGTVINTSLLNNMMRSAQSTGGVNLRDAKPNDAGLGSLVTYKYRVKALGREDIGLHHPVGTPLFVLNKTVPEFPNDVVTADVPSMNYHIHVGYLDRELRKASEISIVEGYKQRTDENNPAMARSVHDFPFRFLGLAHENKNQPLNQGNFYYENGEMQTVLVHTTEGRQSFNLFGERAHGGDSLYMVVKEKPMHDQPLYNYVTGDVKYNRPKRIRHTVMQVEMCVDFKGQGLWDNSADSSSVRDFSRETQGGTIAPFDASKINNYITTFKPVPRSRDIDFISEGHRVSQNAGYRVFDPVSRDYVYVNEPLDDTEAMSNLEFDVYTTGLGRIIGKAKHGWDMDNETTSYDAMRMLAHVSRPMLWKLPKVEISLAESL